jgi:ankyrin repeat protein
LYGQAAAVRALAQAGAALDDADDQNFTPLMIAAQHGYEEVVEALLQAGAEVDKVNANEATPLFTAAMGGHMAVVNALLGAGADVNKARDDGITPLFMAIAYRHEAVVAMLLEAGARVDALLHDGTTPLSLAVTNGNEAMVALLHSWTLALDDPVQQYFLRFSNLPTTLSIVNSFTSPITQLPTEVMSRVLTMPPSCRLLSHQVRRVSGMFRPRLLHRCKHYIAW